MVLAVFVIALMNATLQPCLMAMEGAPNDLAPTSLDQEHANHEGHSTHMADDEGPTCAHCPPSVSHDNNHCSVAVMLDCDILPDLKKGERISKTDLSDAFGDIQSNYHYFDLHCAGSHKGRRIR